jgi:hypothetical protein
MNAAFDTLSASKRLRDAGVEERAADAIVELVQSATHFPDISDLATKADIADMATKADIAEMKADIADTRREMAKFATKDALAELATATRIEFAEVRHGLELLETRFRAELHDKLRVQTFALMGGMTAVIGVATAIIKLAP